MDFHVSVPLPDQPPKWVRDAREVKGLDPQTGRRPEKVGTPLAGGLVAFLVTVAALALFVWFVVAVVGTLLG